MLIHTLKDHLPPISTLFPYTTLFRSIPIPTAGRYKAVRPRSPAHKTRRPDKWSQCCPSEPDSRERIDRKSTRLNSSHVEISYAVFYLKKKKIQNHTCTHHFHPFFVVC